MDTGISSRAGWCRAGTSAVVFGVERRAACLRNRGGEGRPGNVVGEGKWPLIPKLV